MVLHSALAHIPTHDGVNISMHGWHGPFESRQLRQTDGLHDTPLPRPIRGPDTMRQCRTQEDGEEEEEAAQGLQDLQHQGLPSVLAV